MGSCPPGGAEAVASLRMASAWLTGVPSLDVTPGTEEAAVHVNAHGVPIGGEPMVVGSTAAAVADPQVGTLIEVLGRDSCEDTSIVRSRLEALGVPFAYGNSDVDPATGERIRGLNGGHLVTPTVVVGDTVTVEPSIEATDELARAAGHEIRRPSATRLVEPVTDIPIPKRRLPAPGLFDPPPRTAWAGRQVAVFLPHDAACLACFGYARKLTQQTGAFGESGASIAVVVDGANPPDHWEPAQLSGAAVVLDPEGGWREELGAALEVGVDGALLLVLDRYLAPRVVQRADDAGGLITPTEVGEWLAFTALECSC
jgi:hypothetical protein